MMAAIAINWQSPLDTVPVLTRHYLVADGSSPVPKIVSGAQLMTGLEAVFSIAELPAALTCLEGE